MLEGKKGPPVDTERDGYHREVVENTIGACSLPIEKILTFYFWIIVPKCEPYSGHNFLFSTFWRSN